MGGGEVRCGAVQCGRGGVAAVKINPSRTASFYVGKGYKKAGDEW